MGLILVSQRRRWIGAGRAQLLVCAAVLLSLLPWLGARSAFAEGRRLRINELGPAPGGLRVALSYIDGKGSVVPDRTAADFRLIFDGSEQAASASLLPTQGELAALHVLFIVQTSPVMEDILPEVRRGLRRVAESLAARPGVQVGLISYAGEVRRHLEAGRAEDLGAAADRLVTNPDGADVRLLDALQSGLDMLRGTAGRKLIVLFSDGIDARNERVLFVETAQRAQRAGIAIDTIGFGRYEPGKLRSLSEMAKHSYGFTRVAQTGSEIGVALAQTAEEIMNPYVIIFPLPTALDERPHTIQIVQEGSGYPVYSQVIDERVLIAPNTIYGGGWWPRLLLLILLIVAASGGVLWVVRRRRRSLPSAAPVAVPPQESVQTAFVPPPGDVVIAWLLRLSGERKLESCRLGARMVVGSAPDCEIQVVDSGVSAHHCELRAVGGGFKITDLGSTNGLLVNGRPVREHVLIDHDVLQIGASEFKFRAIAA